MNLFVSSVERIRYVYPSKSRWGSSGMGSVSTVSVTVSLSAAGVWLSVSEVAPFPQAAREVSIAQRSSMDIVFFMVFLLTIWSIPQCVMDSIAYRLLICKRFSQVFHFCQKTLLSLPIGVNNTHIRTPRGKPFPHRRGAYTQLQENGGAGRLSRVRRGWNPKKTYRRLWE